MSRFDEWCTELREINPDIYIDPMLRSRFDDPAGYRERFRVQTLSWAMGRPYHNKIDGECCKDFSCCHPDMFTEDSGKRWEWYQSKFGVHQRHGCTPESVKNSDTPEPTTTNDHSAEGCNNSSDRGVQQTDGIVEQQELDT